MDDAARLREAVQPALAACRCPLCRPRRRRKHSTMSAYLAAVAGTATATRGVLVPAMPGSRWLVVMVREAEVPARAAGEREGRP